MKQKLFTLFLVLVASIGIASAQSGTCGTSLTWTLSNNTLTISGTGPMFDYQSSDKVPWFNYVSSIFSINIKNGVTTIGDLAFCNCKNLTSVTIPSTVTDIGNAFTNCQNLPSITIPSSVTSIEANAFNNCKKLSSINIPSSVIYIGTRAFYQTADYNKASNWKDGVLYINNCLIESKVDISGAYTIQEGTRVIANAAFMNCSSLTSVIIPNSITNVGDLAFYNCFSLTSITCNSETPASIIDGDKTFYNVSKDIPVYIPCQATEAYQSANGWDSFTNLQEPDSEYIVTLAVNDTKMGTAQVEQNDCLGAAIISATANEGYHFVQWSDGNTDNPRQIQLTENMSCTAEFAINEYRVTLTVDKTGLTGEAPTQEELWTSFNSAAGFGLGELNTISIVNTIAGVATAENLTAVFAKPEWQWLKEYIMTVQNAQKGNAVGTRTVPELTNDITTKSTEWRYAVGAFFLQTQYTSYPPTADFSEVGKHEAWGSAYQAALDCNGVVAGSGMYQYGATATLTAIPKEHYRFVQWSDGNTDNPRTIMVNSDITLVAEFAIQEHTITVTSDANGAVEGNGIYQYGDTATLTATPNEYYHFVRWSDGNTENPRQVQVTEDLSYTAEFAINEYEVRLTVDGTGLTVEIPTQDELWASFNAVADLRLGDLNEISTLNTIAGRATAEDLTTVFANPEWQWLKEYIMTVQNTQKGNTIPGNLRPDGTERTVVGLKDSIASDTDNSDAWRFAVGAFFMQTQYTTGWPGTADFSDAGKPEAWGSAYQAALDCNGVVAGSGIYQYGATVTISATPKEGNHFVQWSDGITDNPRQVLVTGDLNYAAEFAINEYTVILTSDANGVVSGSGVYQYGATATFTATPNEGYHFVKWSDGNTDNPRTITLISDTTQIAEFAINEYKVQLAIDENGLTGAVPTQEELWTSFNAAVGFGIGELNTISKVNTIAGVATAENLTAVFTKPEWQWLKEYIMTVQNAQKGNTIHGSLKPDGTERTVLGLKEDIALSSDNTDAWRFAVGAFFLQTQYTTGWPGSADFAEAGKPEAWGGVYQAIGVVSGSGVYQHGATATLTATPNEGYHFVQWSDGITNNPRQVLVTGDLNYAAEFAINEYTVILTSDANGVVSGSGVYQYGATATFTATPNEGYHFVQWSDGNTDNPRTIMVISDTTMTAEFVINEYTIALTSGANGVVEGDGVYQHGATATLTATPNEGYHFVQWSDGNTDNPRQVKVTEDMSYAAEFVINEYTVSLTSDANGVVDGSGIYQHGATATLNATPNEGYHFVRWSDGNADNPRNIMVISDTTMTAEFVINEYTIALTSDANGVVEGDGVYQHGATATLTAIPNEGYHFVQWSDGNTDNPRTIMVVSDTTMTAEFVINEYTVSLTSDANGVVDGSGIYQHGATATLNAIPNAGYHFVQWSDGNADNPRTIMVVSDTTMTAEFVINEYTVALTSGANGVVEGDGVYQHGATATLNATPNAGYHFVQWSDGNTDNPRTMTIISDITLSAKFAINVYSVRFLDWNGTEIKGESVEYQSAATAPDDPTREGYTFIGWDNDFSKITEEMTITAQYQINRYQVRFMDYDGTELQMDSVEYQSAAIAPYDPYRQGYTFIGWDKDFTAIIADLDVYAQYEMGEDHEMTIVFTNSEDNDSEIYSQALTIKIPAAPEIIGFTFLYWQPVAEPLTDVITIQAIYKSDIPTANEVYINPANPAQKLLRNGQVYILQDGQTYTIQGHKL